MIQTEDGYVTITSPDGFSLQFEIFTGTDYRYDYLRPEQATEFLALVRVWAEECGVEDA